MYLYFSIMIYTINYCIYYLLFLFLHLLNNIHSLDFAFAAKFLLVRHVINLTFCSV